MPDDSAVRHSRRAALGALTAPILAAPFQQAAGVQPFRVAIPKEKINRILARVRQAQWPDKFDAPDNQAHDWRYGTDWNYMRELAAYWTTRFDWSKAEAKLNSWPQFKARVDEFDVHFYHVRGKGPRPIPLILTHGWPGSVVEFLEAIGPLTDPAKYGAAEADSFDVIIPSLPGFGFTSKPKAKPVGPVTTARLWHTLMRETLGYPRYGAQGGDWGQSVTVQLARQYPDEMIGIHLNAAGGRAVPEAQQSDEERAWTRAAAAYRATELDYFNIQQHKPMTVAFALMDNPLGAAAWIVEKLKSWSDSGATLDALSMDQVLTNIMFYLVTDTMGSAVAFYRGSSEDGPGARDKTMVPTGIAAFPKEMTVLAAPRRMLERDFNLTRYTKMPRGGHFACFEQPQLLVADIREFFRPLRA